MGNEELILEGMTIGRMENSGQLTYHVSSGRVGITCRELETHMHHGKGALMGDNITGWIELSGEELEKVKEFLKAPFCEGKRHQVVRNSDSLEFDVLADPAASYWLKEAVETSKRRDPIDVVNDAEILTVIAKSRVSRLG